MATYALRKYPIQKVLTEAESLKACKEANFLRDSTTESVAS
jgi:hypothetical protein